jgi:hypothetical protein
MNTGIGDAVNLGWKLASVIRGHSPQRILDSYEPERIAFARRLVATTDRVFAVLNSDGAFARTFRTRLVPRIMPLLTRTDAGRRFAFRLVSQIAITYRKSPLSDGRAGRVHAGDRLPWVAFSEPVHGFTDNFAPLTSMQWQLHVYGTSTVELRAWCASRTIELYEFPWRSSMRHTGLMRDAIYLVRPDGHVAYARRRLDLDGLRRFAAAALTSVP